MIDVEKGMILCMVCCSDYFVNLNMWISIVCEKKVDFFVLIYVDVFISL